MKFPPPLGERLVAGIVKDANGCWLWQQFCHKGYGRISVRDKTLPVHRVSWEHFCGPIPAGMHVCHKCDVRNCINPEHLFLGTAKDNVSDMFAKGRQHDRKGTAHSHAKLTNEQVREIRASPEDQYTIASRYGITQSQVSNIRTRKHWSHIT